MKTTHPRLLPAGLRRALPGLPILLLLAAAPQAGAQFTFTNIADNGPIYSAFGIPSINAGGTVGFYGFLDNGDIGLFTSDGTTTTTIVRVNTSTFASPLGSPPSINAAGRLGFFASLDSGGNGVFTSNGATTTTIGLISGIYDTADRPSINDAGTLGFQAALDSGGNGLFTSDGTTTTTIAHTSSPTFDNFVRDPSINSSGTLGFLARLDAGGNGLFTSNGTTTTTIALSSGPTFALFGSFPSINDSGTLGFEASLDTPAGGGSGVFTSNGTTTTTIARSTSPIFQSFGDAPSINTAGTLAFHANLDAFGFQGIFTGNGTTTTEVIRTGDALFGSTVTGLGIGRQALNDSGQLAFYYSLNNSREGIAIATFPEPGLAGDYNDDGTVDAADYVVWRKTDGTVAGFNTWRANFGQTSGSGSVAGANATVPEPTTLVMFIVAAVGIRLRPRCIA